MTKSGALNRVGVQLCEVCGEARECVEGASGIECRACYADNVRMGGEMSEAELPAFEAEGWGTDGYGLNHYTAGRHASNVLTDARVAFDLTGRVCDAIAPILAALALTGGAVSIEVLS